MSWVPLLQARLELGPALRLQVNPRLVSFYAPPPRSPARSLGKRWRGSLRSMGLPAGLAARLQRGCQALASFTPEASAWSDCLPADQHPKAALLADLVAAWPHYRRSCLHAELQQQLERCGEAVYRSHPIRSRGELDRLFEEKLGPLLMSLRTHGYRCRSDDDVGTALIGADGDLIKSDKADHRFFLCRALGLPSLPLRLVAIHPQWLRRHQLSLAPWQAPALRTALTQLASRYQ